MKRCLAFLMVVALPQFADAQRIRLDDLQRAAQALQNGGVNLPPQFGQPGNIRIGGGQGRQEDDRPGTYKFRRAPNSSGDHNTGRFDPEHFFNPQNGGRYQPQPGGGGFSPSPPQNGSGQILPGQVRRPNLSDRQTGYPDPPIAPARRYSGLPIELDCWHGSQGNCPYELITAAGSVFQYNMTAGMNQSLTESTQWSLRYRPTAAAGWQTYRLRGGRRYQLRGTGGQWQLYMLPE